MPDQVSQPTVDQVAPGGIVQLTDAPASLDMDTFDSLFPANPTQIQPPSQTAPNTQGTQVAQSQSSQVQNPPATQTPVQTDPSEDFLKGARSVYKTKDAALEGINQKDALIEQLRQRYALTTGIDPITGQPVGLTPQNPTNVLDYTQNPDKYLEDLYSAAKTGGSGAYVAVQQKFLMDSLKPLQPMISQSIRQSAFDTVGKEVKDFSTFYGTPAYQKALESVPQLKDAIATSESDVKFSAQLPGLYKAAFLIAQGQQLPDLLRAQQTVTQTQPQSQSPIRQTQAPSTQSVPTTVVRPNLRTVDGIRATIADAEARGVKLDF